MLADLQGALAEEVAARIRENGGRATAEALDVTDFLATKRLVENTFQARGRLECTVARNRAIIVIPSRWKIA